MKRTLINLTFAISLTLFSCLANIAAGEWTDSLGRKVKVRENPQRIVALAPSITEILYDLRAEGRIVGVSQFSDFPQGANEKERIGSFVRPNIEKIIALNPDLIIGTADGNPRDSIERLSKLGFSVYMINPRTLDEALESIERIGELIGSSDLAKGRVKDLRNRISLVQEAVSSRPTRPKVFFQLSLNPIITCGPGTFQNSLIHMAGGINLAAKDRLRYPHYSIEEIISKGPEIILITSMRAPDLSARDLDFWR
ncbi:MAG: helical backbone metal receptor, partial [Candidatus Bathyarchaeia archaeon]